MKPRSKIEKRMVGYASELPEIRESVKSWGITQFPNEAIYHSLRGKKSEMTCLCCGHKVVEAVKWSDEDMCYAPYICPKCGKASKVWKYGSNRIHNLRWISYLTVFKDVPVFRTFEMRRRVVDGHIEYDCRDIYQNWITEKREVITGRQYYRDMYHTDFYYDSDYRIYEHNASSMGCVAYEDMFDVDCNYVYPAKCLPALWRQRGLKPSLVNSANGYILARMVLKDNLMEELIKTGQIKMAEFLAASKWRLGQLKDMIHAIRVCTRRGYIISDPSLWVDLFKYLSELGLDTHNAHYVCPDDIAEAHQLYHRRYMRHEDEKKRLKKIKEAREYEAAYKARTERFFDTFLAGDGIKISVFRTVADIAAEGSMMHHCVFDCKYWSHPDTLLLSAQDAEGNHLETIEVDMRTWSIAQSRGLMNMDSPRHASIVSLMESGMPAFKEAAKNKKVKAV